MQLTKSYYKALFIILLIWTITSPSQASTPYHLRGYIKAMPALQLDRSFGDPNITGLFHNRLNFRWEIAEGWRFAAEGRNRLFYNDVFKEFPGYQDIVAHDDGIVDLSWIWLSQGSWIGHSMLDRLYIDWRKDDWQIRAGRQRINWGINLVSNPNDLFNTYSFFDFDYVERPGTDALRIQYHTGFASRVELAWSPGRESRKSTGALLWSTNRSGYDIQALAGYYRHRAAAGLGWAGHIKGAGFKGELTWFYDLEEEMGVKRGNLVAATGLDYMFGNGTFAVFELLYNGGYGRQDQDIFLITQPLQPDNIMFSEYAVTLSASHPFSSVFHGSLALMALPDIRAAFIMPGMKYSLMTDFDLEFVSQVFVGGRDSMFEDAGSAWFLSLQYSF